MPFLTVTNTFVNGTSADAPSVNQNFTDVINATSDGTKNFNISALTCGGTFTANGNMVFGASTANTMTFNGALSSSITIGANTTYDFGSFLFGLRSVYLGGTGIYTARLQAYQGLSASQTWTLPSSIPASTKIVVSDASGNLGASYDVDNSTIGVSANVIAVKANGITRTQQSAVNQMVSTGTSTFSTTSTVAVTITNLASTVTNVAGRPNVIYIVTDQSNPLTGSYIEGSGTANFEAFITIYRGGSAIATFRIAAATGGASTLFVAFPPTLFALDVVGSAGSYAYTAKCNCTAGTTIFIYNCAMIAYEL